MISQQAIHYIYIHTIFHIEKLKICSCFNKQPQCYNNQPTSQNCCKAWL